MGDQNHEASVAEHDNNSENGREPSDEIIALKIDRTKRKLQISLVAFILTAAGMYFSPSLYSGLSPYISLVAAFPIYYCIKILVQRSYRGSGKLPSRWISLGIGLLAILLMGFVPLVSLPVLAAGHLARIQAELSPIVDYVEAQRTKTGKIPEDIIEAFHIAKPKQDMRCVYYTRGEKDFLLWSHNVPTTVYFSRVGTVYSSRTQSWRRIFTDAGPGQIPFQVVGTKSYCYSRQKGVWE